MSISVVVAAEHAATRTNDESAAISHRITSTDTNYATTLASGITVSVTDTTPPQQQQEQQEEQEEDDPPNRVPTAAAVYDADNDGAVDSAEYQQLKDDWLAGRITYAQFLGVVRVYLKSD